MDPIINYDFRRGVSRRNLLEVSLLGASALITGLAPLSHARADNVSPIVETTSGKVRGASSNGINIFKGIHYGARVDGPGRFMPPSKPKPWNNVRDALEFGPPCLQLTDIGLLMPPPGSLPATENCLALNVWTPGLNDAAKRPVMVWLHFSGFSSGDGGLSWTNGENLARRDDVVMVTLNHRINIFGYLYLGELGGEKYAQSGNVGMLDIVLALQWVRDNIASFGGDPNNVTIFGESGGAQKVATLLAMPAAKGLFHKAIVQSGPRMRNTTKEIATKTASAVMSYLDLKPTDVDGLQQVPGDELLLAMKAVLARNEKRNRTYWFSPVIDGIVLPMNPFDPGAGAISSSVPLIVGTTNTESTFMLMGDASNFSLDMSGLHAKIPEIMGVDAQTADALIETYRKMNPSASPSDLLFAITTDGMMRRDAISLAEHKVELGKAATYMYIFSWETPVNGGKLRSSHGMENTFVFENLDAATIITGTGADRQALADQISGAWVAFARTGNPDHNGLPHWPSYALKDRATMIFNDQCQVVDDPGKAGRIAQNSLPPTVW